MRNFFGRLWAGIVGATAGGALGLALTVVLIMMGISVHVGMWITLILVVLGGIAAFAIGNRKLGGK